MLMRIGAESGPMAFPDIFSTFNDELRIIPLHKNSKPSNPILWLLISISCIDLLNTKIRPRILASELPDDIDFLIGNIILRIYSVLFKMLTKGSNFPVELMSEGSNTSKLDARAEAI